MTPAEQGKLRKWVGKWQKLLGLEHFEIFVHFDSANEEGANAITTVDYRYHQARVTFYDSIFDYETPEFIVVHELCHILMDSSRTIVHNLIVGEKFTTWQQFADSDEEVTDRFARLLWKYASGRAK